MVPLKLTFIVLLAFGAVQCQSENVLEPEPRDLDVFLAAQHVIQIVKNVIIAVEKGVQDSKPSIDVLIKQLTPEVGKAVKKVFDDAIALLKRERQRIEFMIKEVEELLGAIKKIKSCTDPSKKDLEKVLGKFENGLLDAVRATMKNQTENLEDIKGGFYLLLNMTRNLFDQEVKNVIGCIKPGHPNAQKCLEGEVEKIKTGVMNLALKIFLFVDEVGEAVGEIAKDLLVRVQPPTETFKKEINPVMKKISDCIAKMK